MILLKNANLPDGVYKNILGILTAQHNVRKQPHPTISINIAEAAQTKQLAANAADSITPAEEMRMESGIMHSSTPLSPDDLIWISSVLSAAIAKARNYFTTTVAFSLDEAIEALVNIQTELQDHSEEVNIHKDEKLTHDEEAP